VRGISLLVVLVAFLSWAVGNAAYAQDETAQFGVRLVEEDVRIPARNGNYTIAAKVLRPEGKGPYGAIVLNHGAPVSAEERPVLLDTSVIIDGRIADISQTGFISGTMIVPRFVLNELQHIADSPEVLRRNRGRRGLDMLNRLKEESVTPVRITDMDVQEAREVDDKLIMLAKNLRCPILTNDYNLNRVAQLQGVVVLNINELANAVKSVLLPGETISVRVIQEGKELGQGVGYLDDGTMIVVEEGRSYIGQTIPVLVKKVLQKTEGRLVFAQPDLER